MLEIHLITVTQEDIDRGIRGNAFNCPLAIAIDRALPVVCEVSVGLDTVTINQPDGVAYWFPLPDAAKDFVKRYDADPSTVKPIVFHLREDQKITFNNGRRV